jgi:hypothetical protein
VFEKCENGYQVVPSHPSIRLWADSEAALIPRASVRAEPLSFTSKSRFLAVPDIQFCDQPQVLKRAYFLGDGTTENIVIEPLTAADALMEWVKHSFLLDIELQPLLASHFDQVARLANHPMHFRLDYPRRYEKLPEVMESILDHIHKKE